MYATLGDQILRNSFCGIDRNREADPGCGAAGRVNRGVDSDYFAMRIDQRTAGIPPIDGGVGLNGFIDQRRLAGLHRTAQRADDAGGQGALKAERVADRQNLLSHL